jgi:hypothetical protein
VIVHSLLYLFGYFKVFLVFVCVCNLFKYHWPVVATEGEAQAASVLSHNFSERLRCPPAAEGGPRCGKWRTADWDIAGPRAIGE